MRQKQEYHSPPPQWTPRRALIPGGPLARPSRLDHRAGGNPNERTNKQNESTAEFDSATMMTLLIIVGLGPSLWVYSNGNPDTRHLDIKIDHVTSSLWLGSYQKLM